MAESGREIFKKANLGKISNRKVIKYGTINKNIGYELTKQNNAENYYLTFVEKVDNEYVYDSSKCINGTLAEMLEYIKVCKEEKKLIKFKNTIDK